MTRPRFSDWARLARPARVSWLRDEEGSAAIEAAVGVPAFLLLVAMILLAGRVALAHQAVEAVAADAARSASIARTAASAKSAAAASARDGLVAEHLTCADLSVSVDTSGFAVPVGTPAGVTARVSCDVRLADLAIPGVPGTRIIRAEITSPIDTFRDRR